MVNKFVGKMLPLLSVMFDKIFNIKLYNRSIQRYDLCTVCWGCFLSLILNLSSLYLNNKCKTTFFKLSDMTTSVSATNAYLISAYNTSYLKYIYVNTMLIVIGHLLCHLFLNTRGTVVKGS